MKKILVFATIYFLSLSVGYSQDTWLRLFSEEYEYTYDNVYKSLAFDDNYMYFISSSSFPANDPNFTEFSLKSSFYKVDMDGNLITKKYLSEGYEPYWYSAVNLKILDDGNLLAFGNYKTEDGTFPHFVMKLTPEGEQIWVNYLPTYLGNGSIEDIEELEDGRIILLGFGLNNILEHKVQIYKLSAIGEIIWNKVIPNPSGFFSRSGEHSMIILPTTGDIMFTSQLFITGSNSHAYATVTKLDSVGNYQWDRPIYLQSRDFKGTVMELLPDGNLIFATTVDTSGFGLWPVYRKFAKMDTSAQILWEYEEPVMGFNEFWDVKVTDNGDILFAGENSYGNPFSNPDATNAGNIVKISGNGELLWERFYKLSDNVQKSFMPITKLEMLPSGGILAIGITGRFFHAGNRDVMLMKLDSNGCLNGTCDTLNILTGFKNTPNTAKQVSINVYPNPNTGSFYLDIPKGIENLDVNVYNGLGQVIKQYRQVTKHQLLQIDKKGVYFVSVSWKDQVLTSKIVLIE